MTKIADLLRTMWYHFLISLKTNSLPNDVESLQVLAKEQQTVEHYEALLPWNIDVKEFNGDSIL